MKSIRWICKSTDRHTSKESYSEHTLAFTRKGSISACLGESSYSWAQVKRFGWKCVKVEVTITEI